MTDAVADFLATAAVEPKADRELVVNGRYKIPHPETGKIPPYGGFQRTTNLAKMMEDTYAIDRWRMARTMRGLAMPEQANLLLEAAVAADEAKPDVDDPDKVKAADRKLNDIAERAQEAAGSTSKREQGTALHALIERMNRGEQGVTAPGKWGADVAAYRREVERIGLEIPKTAYGPAVELVFVNTRYNVAGRGDLVGRLAHRPHPLIGDLKTGGVEGKGLSIGVQLAVYATADWVYDPASETFTRMADMFPDLDQTEAFVIHLPAGSGECNTYQVPLVDTVNDKGETVLGGISLADYAAQVREARSRSRGIIVPYDTTGGTWPKAEASEEARTPDPIPEDRTTWIRQRLTAMVHDTYARGLVVTHWPEGVPAQPPWTPEQVDAIARTLDAVERVQAAPFPPPDPEQEAELQERHLRLVTSEAPPAAPRAPDWPIAHEEDEQAPVEMLEEIRDMVRALTTEQQFTVQRWGAEGKRHRCPWDSGATAREAAIVKAAVRCVACLWCDEGDDMDALMRAALAESLSGTKAAPFDTAEEQAALIAPTWDLGAILGHLSYAEAVQLDKIAVSFDAGDDATVARLGTLVVAAPAAPEEEPTNNGDHT